MEIKGFIENSLLEWEGWISSVLFLPHCNLRCHYCHAGHLIHNPGILESVPLSQIMDCWDRQRGWIDGVVVTGGECTLHGEGLVELLRQIRGVPLKTAIETNGTLPDVIRTLLSEGLLDAIAMDVKAPLATEDYHRVTNKIVDVDGIRRSLRMILDAGLPHEFRITVAPTLVEAEDLRRIAPELEGAEKVAIQNFKPDLCLNPEFRGKPAFSPGEMEEFHEIVAPHVERCVLRGQELGLSAEEPGLSGTPRTV